MTAARLRSKCGASSGGHALSCCSCSAAAAPNRVAARSNSPVSTAICRKSVQHVGDQPLVAPSLRDLERLPWRVARHGQGCRVAARPCSGSRTLAPTAAKSLSSGRVWIRRVMRSPACRRSPRICAATPRTCSALGASGLGRRCPEPSRAPPRTMSAPSPDPRAGPPWPTRTRPGRPWSGHQAGVRVEGCTHAASTLPRRRPARRPAARSRTARRPAGGRRVAAAARARSSQPRPVATRPVIFRNSASVLAILSASPAWPWSSSQSNAASKSSNACWSRSRHRFASSPLSPRPASSAKARSDRAACSSMTEHLRATASPHTRGCTATRLERQAPDRPVGRGRVVQSLPHAAPSS